MTPTQELSISAVFKSMKSHARANLQVLIRITLVFALLRTALVPLSEISAMGQAISLGFSLLLSTTYAGMAAAMICLPGEGKPAGKLWASVSPMLATLVWASLLISVAIGLSVLLIIVPFILLTIWAVAVPAIVVEKIGVIESLKRSRELVNGNGWRVFGFGACLAIITLAVLLISLIIVIPFGTGMAGLLVSNFVAVCVSYPLLLTGPAALYNELVERQPEPVPEPL